MNKIWKRGWKAASGRIRGWAPASLATVAVIVSAAVVACSDHPVAPAVTDGVSTAATPNLGRLTTASAGAYHNAFLDFSFPRMLKAVSQGADHARGCRVIAQAMRDFVVLHKLPVHPREISDAVAGGRCAAGRGRPVRPSFSLAETGITSPAFDALVAEMVFAVESGLPPGDIAAIFDQKVAYARAHFPPADADVIAAAASVGLSSVEYWEANYVTQYDLLKAQTVQTVSRIPGGAPLPLTARAGVLHAPPQAPLFWRQAARRVGIADLKGAVVGGISGIRGGWNGVLSGAVIEGGAKSAGALLAELF